MNSTSRHSLPKRIAVLLACYLAICLCSASPSPAQNIDFITLGNSASEASHSVVPTNTAAGTDSFGDSYRSVQTPASSAWIGGTIDFTIGCSPNSQNYVTLKFNGSESTNNGNLWLQLTDGRWISTWEAGDWPAINRETTDPPFPGRYTYSTYMLPRELTAGQTNVRLRITGTGYFYDYAGSYASAENPMTQPTRGIYRIYSHSDPFFVPQPDETQGTQPAPGPVPVQTMDTRSYLMQNLNTYANTEVTKTQTYNDSDKTGEFNDLKSLDALWSTSDYSYYHNPVILPRICAILDHNVAWQNNLIAANPAGWLNYTSDWYLYSAGGSAVVDTYNALNSGGYLNELISPDGTTATPYIPRWQAYVNFFQQARDQWLKQTPLYSNQNEVVTQSVYESNQAIAFLEPSLSDPQSAAISWLYQADGYLPWAGTPAAPLTFPYYEVSTFGISKELGYVAYYGELGEDEMDDYIWSGGDTNILGRIQAMESSRPYFRVPANDVNGYQTYRQESVVEWRQNEYPGRPQYGPGTWYDSFHTAANLPGDSMSLREAQLFLTQNRIFTEGADTNYVWEQVQRLADYDTIAAKPASSYRMPWESGQPDFAFADPDAGVIAIKHGTDQIFISPFWRSIWGVNSIARIHYSTPAIDRVVNMPDETQFANTGHYWETPDAVGHPTANQFNDPTQHLYRAYDELPIKQAPDGTWNQTNYQDYAKSDFYSLRYGNYLIAMNTSPTKTYQLAPPAEQGLTIDLISGQSFDLSEPATVGPRSTVAFYLASQIDPAPIPAQPLNFNARGGLSQVLLTWNPASNGQTYTVKRSATTGGPYSDVAAGIASTSYVDATVTNGTPYYYVVAADNSNGEGNNSYEESATAQASEDIGIPAPLEDADIGAVTVKGTTTYASGVYTATVTAADTGTGNTADAFHWTFQAMSGNISVIARVVSQTSSSIAPMAGVMIRETLDSNARYACQVCRQSTTIDWRYRTGWGGTVSEQYFANSRPSGSPYWVRLDRQGNLFTAYQSPDGVTWTQTGTPITMDLPNTVYVGLYIISSSTTQSTKAVFDNAAMTSTGSIPGVGAAATPIISASPGTYVAPTTVSVSAPTPASAIYYTTDGTVPTVSSAAYTSPLTLSSSEIFNAIAIAPGYNASAIATAKYTILPATSPVTTASLSATAGNNGWYTSSATVTLSATDSNGSNYIAATYYAVDGTATQTYSSPFLVAGDGTHTVTFWSVDTAGNAEAANSLTLKIDSTAPTLAFGVASPAANAAGWNSSSVTIPFTASDATSGVSSALPGSPLSFSIEGAGQTQTVVVTDVAGNAATFASPAVNIDLTAPVTSESGATSGSTYTSAVTISLAAADNLSGVAGTYYALDGAVQMAYSSPITVSSSGSHTISYWSVDNAGNVEIAHTLTFAVSTAPSISMFSPASAIQGSKITITGVNFTGATYVRFNGASTSFTVNSPTQITATVPSKGTTGPISVTAPSGTATSTASFTYLYAPTITSFSPTSAASGTIVIIAGTNFTGATYVRFNGSSTSFTVNSSTQISATVPTLGSTGKISVTTPAGTATSAASFTYILAPSISSFTPASGISGSKVTITGTNLTAATYVRFNGASTSFAVNSATKITATVPSLGSTGTISVTTSAGTATSATNFTYMYLPTITSFTPTTGKSGTTVVITGTNFTGATYVRFNGASTSFTVNSATQITAKVPTKGSTGPISVTTNAGTCTSAGTFTY